jgi:regulator of PEP synthase PpsR (kinase-PPPase family)
MPTITLHSLSDSIGETAETVARILETQFPQVSFAFQFTTMIDSPAALRSVVLPWLDDPARVFVYTFTNPELQVAMAELVGQGAHAIDILGKGIALVSNMVGQSPAGTVGVLHQVDSAYFSRIGAMDYSVNHDDGKLPETLIDAQIVLIGVSRTSKTPLSMYLALRGFRTANIPLTLETPPPSQLFDVDPHRIFGLIATLETLQRMRTERMEEMGTFVDRYATADYIQRELEYARGLMRQIGCLIINTHDRAIEETAQEILRYL